MTTSPPRYETKAKSSRSFLSTAGTNGLLALLNIATGIIVAHVLGPHGRGELAAIQTLPTVIAAVSMVGQTDALVYFGGRRPRLMRSYVVTAVMLATLFSAVTSLIFVVFAPQLLHAQSSLVVRQARIYMLIGPLFALAWLPFHTLRGLGQFGRWNLFRLAPVAGWFLIVVFYAAVGGTHNASRLADGYLVMTGAIGVVIWCVVMRATRGTPLTLERERAGELLRFGAPAAGATLPQMLNLRLDQIFLGAVIAPRGLGLYSAGVAWSSAVLPIVTALGLVLFPRLASANGGEHLDILSRTSRLAFTVSALGAVGASLLAPLMIPVVFGGAYRGATVVAAVLCAATAIYAWNYVLEEGLRGMGLPGGPMKAQATGLGITVIALVVAVPPWGIMGAAVASIAGYGAAALVNTGALMRRGASPSQLLVPRREDVQALFVLVAKSVKRAHHNA